MTLDLITLAALICGGHAIVGVFIVIADLNRLAARISDLEDRMDRRWEP